MEERLFWMNRNQQGLYESGFLLNLDDLKAEFEDPSTFDVNLFLTLLETDPNTCLDGSYRGDDTFTVIEIHSMEELKSLLTWKDFDPFESHASGSFDEIYPDFVNEDFRRCRYVYNFTGYTANHLPTSGCCNSLYGKYMDIFNLSPMQMEYSPTYQDLATKDIQDIIRTNGTITVSEYNDILKKYHGLTDKTVPPILNKAHQCYKNIIMAALDEAVKHNLLGSIGDKKAKDLYNRLKFEDYCISHNKTYEELTDEDYESYYEEESTKDNDSIDYERD